MTLAQLDAEDPVDYDILASDWEREQGKCGKCGRPSTVCSDPATAWYPQRSICYSEMETTAARQRYDDLHGEGSGRRFHDGTETRWSERIGAATPYPYDAGVSVWSSPENLTPDDHFLEQRGVESNGNPS